jgi:glycosyltransferase involved in cell wall biosynthesis
MRVLVTADTLGGVWTYARELVTGLSRRGVEVVLVSFGEIPSAEQTEWLDGLRNVDYRATAFRLEWMQDCAADLEASSEFLLDLISECRPDLLHLSQFCYGALPTTVPKILVAHSDVVSWWQTIHGAEPPASDWIKQYRNLVQRGVQEADMLVAPSYWMLETACRLYGPAQDSMVVYNGRNPGLFNPHVSKTDLVVTVGRLWDRAKQVMLLTESRHDWPVWVAGDEQHPDPAFRSDHRLRAPGIRFCGKQSEPQLRQLFNRASIYVATSQYEPFGLAPLEAALSRCAIIANDIPTFREIWGDAACYFRRNDPEDLARKIDNLQRNSELRQTYGNLAYRRAKERFTADRMVTEYVNLYESFVPAGAAAA